MIELSDYWMGRDSRHRGEMTLSIQASAADLIARVNLLITFPHGLALNASPTTGSLVSSGWRPPVINAATPGSAILSRHLTGQAVDLFDPDGAIDAWCWEHQDVLARPDIDLYMEHPAATKGWCHLQSVPPLSQVHFPPHDRKRWFYP